MSLYHVLSIYLSIYLSICLSTIVQIALLHTCLDGFWRNLDTMIIGWWVISDGQTFKVKGHLGAILGHFRKTLKILLQILLYDLDSLS